MQIGWLFKHKPIIWTYSRLVKNYYRMTLLTVDYSTIPENWYTTTPDGFGNDLKDDSLF